MIIEDLKRQVLLSNIKFSGTFKDCIPVGPYVLLYGPLDEKDLTLTQESINKYSNVKISKIIGWEVDKDAGYVRGPDGQELPVGWVQQERAPGKPLGDTRVITQGTEIRDVSEIKTQYNTYLSQVQKYLNDLWGSTDVSLASVQEFIAGQDFLRDKPLTLDSTNPGNVNYSRRAGLTSFDYSTNPRKTKISDDEFLFNMCNIFAPQPPPLYLPTGGGRLEPEIILPRKLADEVEALQGKVIAPRLKTALCCQGIKGDVDEYINARLANALVMEDEETRSYIENACKSLEK